MRYAGQGWEVPVSVAVKPYTADDGTTFRTAFEKVYEQLFGRLIDKLDIEIVSWSLRASSQAAPAEPVAVVAAQRDVTPTERRQMFDARASKYLDAAVVARASLVAGDRVSGPAAITEDETTTIITQGQEIIMQSDGCLLIRARA